MVYLVYICFPVNYIYATGLADDVVVSSEGCLFTTICCLLGQVGEGVSSKQGAGEQPKQGAL